MHMQQIGLYNFSLEPIRHTDNGEICAIDLTMLFCKHNFNKKWLIKLLPGGGKSSGDVIDISIDAGGGGFKLYWDRM